MDITITYDRENKVLNRREIGFSIDKQSGTPNKSEISKEVCKKLNLDPECTVVVKVDQEFGRKTSTGIIHSYESKELLQKHAPKHILDRSSKGAPKPKPAEEPKQE